MSRKIRRRAVLFRLALLLPGLGSAVTSCNKLQSGASTDASGKDPEKVTIAYQPGLGYASLIVVKQQKTLEKQFPNTKIEWKVLSSGSAIRDGVIANQIQVGAMGIAPFLMPHCRSLMVQVRLILEQGAGHVVLDRLPLDEMSLDEAKAIN